LDSTSGRSENFLPHPAGISTDAFFSPQLEIFTMKLKQIAAAFTLATTLLAGGTAFAAGPTNAEYFPFQGITSMKTLDQTNDGVVSRKDDVNARKMGAKGDAMTTDQSREILMYLKAGG